MGPGGLCGCPKFRQARSLRAAFLLELPGEVRHHTLDGPLVQRAGLVLQNEAQSVGFLALGKLVALVDIEQRDAFQQLALGGEGCVAQRGEGHGLVHQQRQIASDLGEFRQFPGGDLQLLRGFRKGLEIHLQIVHILLDIGTAADCGGHGADLQQLFAIERQREALAEKIAFERLGLQRVDVDAEAAEQFFGDCAQGEERRLHGLRIPRLRRRDAVTAMARRYSSE